MRRVLARGAEHFNRGEFFEAHEIWEESWTTAPVRYRYFLQGIIHFAVAFHHRSHGNMEGFEKQLTKGRKRLALVKPILNELELVFGFNGAQPRLQVTSRCKELDAFRSTHCPSSSSPGPLNNGSVGSFAPASAFGTKMSLSAGNAARILEAAFSSLGVGAPFAKVSTV